MTQSPSSAAAQQIPISTAFADLDEEFAATRRLLERFPDEHAEWRPHEHSMTLKQLAAHVANLPHFAQVIAESPEFDFAATPYVAPTASTRAEILELFEARSAAASKAVAGLDANSMTASWCMRNGDTVILSGPRALHLRKLMMSHIAHHRGQLSVYYRLLGVPVPGMYGPSADER
jgi:uncharacterized damage-inducible protein DinB